MSDPAKEFVDQCGGSCYGRQDFRKLKGRDEYTGSCKEACRLKDQCINASRERRIEIHHNFDEVVYLDSIESGDVNAEAEQIRDENAEEQIIGGIDDVLSLGQFRLSPTERSFAFELMRRIADWYLAAPKHFDAMMRKQFQGKTIAQQARDRGIRKQAVSAAAMRELAGMKSPAVKMRDLLSGLELAVYNLCFEDGCTVRSAAVQLSISPVRVQRVKQKIRTKIAKCETSVIVKEKKNRRKVNGL